MDPTSSITCWNRQETDLGVEIERVVTLDKLTYAGNPENLAGLKGENRHRLVEGDICDTSRVGSLIGGGEDQCSDAPGG